MKNFTAKASIPAPSVERLAHLYTVLTRLEDAGAAPRLTSRTLGELLSVPDHTIRKDLSLLRNLPPADGRGYDLSRLRAAVGERLGLDTPRPVCLVGLGRLGSAILQKTRVWTAGRYPLAAAFDASVNRIELSATDVPLYHSRDITRVVRENNISIGIIAVPAGAAAEVAERLAAGGVRAIVNFAPVILPSAGDSVIVRNVSLTGELDVLSAYLNIQGV